MKKIVAFFIELVVYPFLVDGAKWLREKINNAIKWAKDKWAKDKKIDDAKKRLDDAKTGKEIDDAIDDALDDL